MDSKSDINVRRVALEIVDNVLENGQFLNETLSEALSKYQYIDKKRRSFLSYLTRGCVERYIELDAVISAYSSTKINKLNPNIRNILRLAVYELRYMDSVPESATCNEYVKLAGKKAPVRLKGFVNGVLRSMIRDDFAKVSLSEYEKYSMPKWLYDKLDNEYGNASAIASAFLSNRKITIRTNIAKTTPDELVDILSKEDVKVKPIDGIDYAFGIEGVDYLEGLDSFNQGLFYVQDVSSMMVGVKSDVKATDTVIDVCAAPGGKSLHVAQLMKACYDKNTRTESAGRVLSFDISKGKVDLIRENIDRAGLDNVTVDVGDATCYNESLQDKADIVIADVPCSGIGVIAKKPDIKARLQGEDIDKLATLQYKILDNVKNYVKSGGKLIYSTCTISKSENEDNVDRFLEDNSEFTLIEQNQYMPSDIQDGFYIAVMKKC